MNFLHRINKIEVNEVTDEQRQQAKQIVYGIIYGVGAKTLAEQLSLTEQEAEKFMDSFKVDFLVWYNSNVSKKFTQGNLCKCSIAFQE